MIAKLYKAGRLVKVLSANTEHTAQVSLHLNRLGQANDSKVIQGGRASHESSHC